VSLRVKLLLAQIPLALALIMVGIVAVGTLSSLGRLSEGILRENYRSVLAAERMKEALERLDDEAAASLIRGNTDGLPQRLTPLGEHFNAELHVQEGNITEPGEDAAVRRLQSSWAEYQARLDEFAGWHDLDAARRFFFDRLEVGAAQTRAAAQAILDLNQDAMVRKSERAQVASTRMNTLMILAAVIACLAGSLASATVTQRLLQPLAVLTETVRHIGEGNFGARAAITGSDELAQLAANVNAMATRLSQYRRSSLGELLLAQQASQAAIDSLPDPVVVFDAGGGALIINRAAETLLGLQLESTTANALARLEAPVRAVLETARAHVLSGKGAYVPKGFDEAVRVAAADGERYLLPRATPVYSEEGAVTGATVVLQDVTRLRRVDELRNDLVATVAHEFRTPLTSLRMAIHLMIEQAAGPLSEKQADLLYAARDDCERLQSIVDELLDLARIQGGRIELNLRPVAATALVDTALEAYRNLAEEAQLALESELPPGLGEVAADRDRIQLVFSNLLANAIRHTPAGGQITIRGLLADGRVRFEVADTGEGITPELQRVIFEKFVRGPGTTGGAGLGLAIARDVVEAHGGEIGVESVPGAGATFWFTLPRA